MAERTDQPPALRRSSRSIRGSLKPVIDLVKDEEEDGEDEEEEAAAVSYDGDDIPEVLLEKKSAARRKSQVKKEPKLSTKRGLVKKSTAEKVRPKQKQPKKEEKDEDELANAIKVETKREEHELHEKPEDADEFYYELSEKEMKEINHAFDLNRLSDTEELLAADGLRTAIRSLGFEPRGDEIKRLMKKHSIKNRVNRDGFHKIMAFKFGTMPAVKSDRSNDEITRVFSLLDFDKTGMITLDNLRSIASELNEDLTEDDLREMIVEADQDGDFMINKEEFHNIMKKTSLY